MRLNCGLEFYDTVQLRRVPVGPSPPGFWVLEFGAQQKRPMLMSITEPLMEKITDMYRTISLEVRTK